MKFIKLLILFSFLVIAFFTVSCQKESKLKVEEKEKISVSKIMFELPQDVKAEILKTISELKKYDVKNENNYGLNFVNNDVDSENDLKICIWILNSKENKGFSYILNNTNRFAKISEEITLPIMFGSEFYFVNNIPRDYSRYLLERCFKCIYFTHSNVGIGNYKITKIENCGNGI